MKNAKLVNMPAPPVCLRRSRRKAGAADAASPESNDQSDEEGAQPVAVGGDAGPAGPAQAATSMAIDDTAACNAPNHDDASPLSGATPTVGAVAPTSLEWDGGAGLTGENCAGAANVLPAVLPGDNAVVADPAFVNASDPESGAPPPKRRRYANARFQEFDCA